MLVPHARWVYNKRYRQAAQGDRHALDTRYPVRATVSLDWPYIQGNDVSRKADKGGSNA